MRVLMVHSFHHPRGGDTTYRRDLTTRLRAAGHQVVPLSMRHPDNEPSVWEARFPCWVDMRAAEGRLARARAALGMVWSAEAAHATAGLVRDAQPDVAHIQHIHRHLTPAILPVLRKAGVPIIWTVHDYELVCPSGLLFAEGAPCERCRGHRYHQAVVHRCKWGRAAPSIAVAIEKQVHRLARTWTQVDRYLCPSRYLAETLVRFGMPAERIEHLPNFLDCERTPASDEPGQGWLYAGRLAEEKGVHVAIAAARRLPGHPLYICGGGPLEAHLRALAADLPWVHFLGQLPRAEVAQRLQSVRAVVVPSLWPENFPYAVIEAQAAARPVVASRIGGIPEQIEHGRDGLLVPPGDVEALTAELRKLVAAPERARAMGLAARQRVEETLRPARHLQRVLEVYEELRLRGTAPG